MAEFEAGQRSVHGFLAAAWGVLETKDKPTRDRILQWLAARSESDEREAQAKASGGASKATHWSSGRDDGGFWVDGDPELVTAMVDSAALEIIELDGWAIIDRKYGLYCPTGQDGENEPRYFATREEAEAFVASMQQPEEPI